LILLFAISVTGLMLTASYSWMKGYAYDFLAILHAITVIFTLLWLPFGKFFHIFQRPAQLGVGFYQDVGQREDQAKCRRCGEAFASRMHIEDLIQVEKQLGFRYEMKNSAVEHYQWICPRCRRAMLALAQGRLWQP
jgi:ribosomal protein S27AE